MAIISKIEISNPQNIEMSMKIRMTVKEWCALRSRINEENDYWSTSNAFCRSIKELVDKAEKEFVSYESSDN